MSTVSEQQRVLQEVSRLGPWFHNLHLPDGTQTAPAHELGDFPSFKWNKVSAAVPQDLSGWTVLDIGCNAGYYSFELARRGARVTGIDLDPHYLEQARWAAKRFGFEERTRFVQAQIYELARWTERFDLVWFTGVFYHLRYPVLALDLVRRLTSKLMMFQTLTLPDESEIAVPPDLSLDERQVMLSAGWPKMAFIEHQLAGDPTNWWAPNHACVVAVLRSAGFRVEARPEHEFYLCSPIGSRCEEELEQVLTGLRR